LASAPPPPSVPPATPCHNPPTAALLPMPKSPQTRLPGLESEPEPPAVLAPATRSRPNSGCEYPDTPATGAMGIDVAELPAEPIEQHGLAANLMGKTVYVVDAYSLIFQVFHAFSRSQLPTPPANPPAPLFPFAPNIFF